MSAITDMVVSALIGGAGVKILELFVSWRKENSAASVAEDTAHRARVKEYADLEASLRKELRGENEKLRERLKKLEGPASPDATGSHKVPPDDELKELSDPFDDTSDSRKTTAALAQSQSLMAQTIVDQKVELERLKKELEKLLRRQKP